MISLIYLGRMRCEYCDIIEEQRGILYEDDNLVIAVRDKVFTPGQITVFPKKHQPILELVSDEILKKCSVVANKVSIAVFESMGSKGTNIIIKNGLGASQNVPHFGIEVVPRQEEDQLQLSWEGRPMAEDEIDLTFQLLGEAVKNLDKAVKNLDKVKEGPDDEINEKSKKGNKKESSTEKDNYLKKSLRRIP